MQEVANRVSGRFRGQGHPATMPPRSIQMPDHRDMNAILGHNESEPFIEPPSRVVGLQYGQREARYPSLG
jgi:hypothetical protein